MQDKDIPLLDESVVQLPADFRQNIAEQAKNSLWFMAYAVLGYRKLTPRTHGGLCLFMSENQQQFRVVLYPRDHFKTTICTISDSIRLSCIDPEIRLLIANETATNAERFLTAIERQWEQNRVLRTLFSSCVPDTRKVRWNNKEMELARSGYYPEPTIDTIGAEGASTSRHYTHIKLDDLISRKAADSPDVMKGVIQWMDNIISLLVEPIRDRVDLIGTRWAFFDIYGDFLKAHEAKVARYIRGAVENGVPIFPELMTLEVLDSIRNKNPYLYSCQYANNPRNPDLQDFNIAAVKRYRFSQRGDSVVIEDGNETTVIPLKSLDVVITCDPSIGEKVKDDPVAIMVCGVDPEGRVFVLDVFNKRCTPIEMIEKFFVMYFRWNCRILGIEGVAYQKAIKYFVAQEMEARQKWMNVQELKVDTTKSKETRIRGLQPLVATGRLYVRAEQQELLDQLDEFPLGEHDDILDTLQMQQQLWRGVVSKKRMEEYEVLEKEIIAGLKHTSATGYGPSDRSLFHSSDFDLDGDDDLEVRSAWEHQGSTMVEVV